jgi:hypothetical protein
VLEKQQLDHEAAQYLPQLSWEVRNAAMCARLRGLFVVFCSAFLMAGTHAGSSESGGAKSVMDAPEPRPSAGSDQPISQPANADPGGQDQHVISGDTAAEQTSSQPDIDVGGAKRGGDSAAAPGLQADNDTPRKTTYLNELTCVILKAAAAANGLPLEFFARVIWEESRFKPNAIGPRTRTGHRAQGIAQFMPYTATERGLADPFNPEFALPEAAEFLAELRREFGNLGLAAAAYNAGPGRVRDLLDGRGGMPAQTRHYVRAITGHAVEEWAVLGRETRKDGAKSTSCRLLAALLKERPTFSIGTVRRTVRDTVEPAKGAKLGKSSARLSRSVASTRSKRRPVRGPVRTAALDKVIKASEERFDQIMQICRGCLPANRLKSGKSSARPSRSEVSTRSKTKPTKGRLRTLARDRMRASEHILKKMMQICRGC